MIVFATNLADRPSDRNSIVIENSLLWYGISVQQRSLLMRMLIRRKWRSDGKASVISRSVRLVCKSASG